MVPKHVPADRMGRLPRRANLVKLGEAAVKMNVYAPPPPDQIGLFCKFYGADIYPTVKEA